jgi:PHP family Zn ribbon phosphoesterase
MNWRLSQLDNITLISNSDAHSLPKIGREANVFDTELGNLPRPTPKKEEIEEILKTKYLKEINEIQSNIDILYKRYYEIIPITDIWYNKSMTDMVVEKTRKVCCDGCTCETSHSAEPVKE